MALADQVLVTGGRQAEDLGDPAVLARRTTQRSQMAKARAQFRMAMDSEQELRANMTEDLRFVASDQWDRRDKSERLLDRRPCLTINRLNQFVRQVVNASRQLKPAIKVSPIDSGADPETAEVFQGIIRHIEQQSDALAAYLTAAEAQARIGRGWWRITTEFDDDTQSFAQQIRIRRVRNPFTVVWDPASAELDGSDARFAFVIEDLPTDVYTERYGAPPASLSEFGLLNDQLQDWMPIGKVRIAEWWTVDLIADEILLLAWRDNREEQIVRGSIFATWPEEKQQAVEVLRRRRFDRREVRCAVINAAGILEGNDDQTAGALWPGKWIPIVPVYGEEIDQNGKLDYRGMVRDAKGPQQMYNYEVTSLAEALQTAPKSPWIGAEGSFEGHEEKYEQANRRNFPYLEYKPQSIGGQLTGPPARTSASADIGGFVAAIAQGDNDLKATTGLFDPSLGNKVGSAQSGKAIQALQQQGELANSNFLDNLGRAVRFTGRLCLDLIPKIYDAPKVMRILGDDDRPKDVLIHAGVPVDKIDPALKASVDRIYDLSVGRYDVSISVGPSLESRRQEAVQGMTGLLSAAPQLAVPLADLIVGNLDFADAAVAATRLRKMLPPELQQDDQGEESEIPPQVQAQIQQLGQQGQQMQQALQQMTQELAQAKQMLDSKQIEITGKATLEREKMASEERIARLNAEASIIRAQITATKDKELAAFEAHADAIMGERDHQRTMEREGLTPPEPTPEPGAPPVPRPPAAGIPPSVPPGVPGGPTAGGPPTGGMAPVVPPRNP